MLRIIKFYVLLQSQNTAVSSSSLVRTSGFHPGNRGSNPLETTNKNHRATSNSSGFFSAYGKSFINKTHLQKKETPLSFDFVFNYHLLKH